MFPALADVEKGWWRPEIGADERRRSGKRSVAESAAGGGCGGLIAAD